MPLVVSAVARSHVGLVRIGNEDSGYAGSSLFVVADGMGGHAAGEVASRTVVAALLGLDGADLGPDLGQALRNAVTEANDRLRLAVEARPDLDGMGTTLTALVWDGARLGLVNVGDSRAYLLREGRLTRVSHDQSLVQTLLDEGRITPSEARIHPQRAVILQALDGRTDLEPDVSMLDPRAGDRYLLGSDGLTDYVDESAVEAVLRGRNASAAVDGLIGLALEAGAPDNVTVIVLDVVEAEIAQAPPIREPGGVLVGAVGETAATATPPSAPAGDAPSVKPEDAFDDNDEDEDEDAQNDEDRAPTSHRLRRRRWPWLAGLALVVALAVGVGGWRWAQDQWYVGVDNGNVAIYSGVDLSLGPFSLSTLEQRTALEVATLPEFERSQVEGGIASPSRSDAEETVARLQVAADSCLAVPLPDGCP